jgi:hypothetical protein
MAYRYIPFLNFSVSTSAFIFQMAVLNPWHKQISYQLQRIEQDIKLLQQKNKIEKRCNNIKKENERTYSNSDGSR